MLANAGTVENLFALLFVLTLVGAALATVWPADGATHSVVSLWHKMRWGHV